MRDQREITFKNYSKSNSPLLRALDFARFAHKVARSRVFSFPSVTQKRSMSYPITTPVTFEVGAPAAEIDFVGTGPDNKMKNFVATTPGDLLYRPNGVNNYLERLPIGATGEVLQSIGGLPVWSNAINVLSQGIFTATVIGSVNGIPTSRTGGANSNVWFQLYGDAPVRYVTWSTTSPASDPDSTFSLTAGVTYGTFGVPSNGIYTLSAQICFDSGTGVNAGSGITGIPAGMAIRQAQIYNITTGTPLFTTSAQNSGSNNNQTIINMAAENVQLTSGDRIGIRVRHDRSAANTVTIGNPAISLPFMTVFAGKRSR